MTSLRNTQLDGWRAFAVMGVIWLHWTPPSWRGPVPFEIGLFFFLTLTGFLITRILLKERAGGENSGKKWITQAYLRFQKRRMLRILIPCYAAMLFAILVGAPDIREHWFAYFGHWSNFHIAGMPHWPSGTSHYWTLAIQMQFYLLWPFLIFFTPQKWLRATLTLCVALAPLSRMILSRGFPQIYHHETLPTTALDYFGVGALLALAMSRGMKAGDERLARWAKIAFAAYAVLYGFNELKRPIPGLCYFQQTFVAIAFAGLISSTFAGFHGPLGKLLNHSALQHIGRLSYGLYLFHTPTPLLLGIVLPWLWHPFFSGPFFVIKLFAYALAAWGMAFLCWRFLEKWTALERLVDSSDSSTSRSKHS